MNHIEAMKQALEALEEINKLSIGENAICLPAEIDGAMDALRQAIAELEKQEPVALDTVLRKAIVRSGKVIHPPQRTEEEKQTLSPRINDARVHAEHDRQREEARKLIGEKQEPVIDKSAAIRIATALGWHPQRQPLTDELTEVDCLHCGGTGINPETVYGDKISCMQCDGNQLLIDTAHGIKGEA
jgi:hypothetical protein